MTFDNQELQIILEGLYEARVHLENQIATAPDDVEDADLEKLDAEKDKLERLIIKIERTLPHERPR